jgi:hypothetical protein
MLVPLNSAGVGSYHMRSQRDQGVIVQLMILGLNADDNLKG